MKCRGFKGCVGLTSNGGYCGVCKERNRLYAAERRRVARIKGICTGCFVKKVVIRKLKCQKCLDSAKGRDLKWAHGVTPKEVGQRRTHQKNSCAICGNKFVQTPHMDHDHVTGQNRDLLCGDCNKGLGYFRDNPESLRKAAKYIDKHKRRGQNDTRPRGKF